MPKDIDPCKKYACAIQKCLNENRFQEPSCETAINDMKNCCMKWKEKSYVCDGFKSFFAASSTNDEPPTRNTSKQ